jgi:hypothetical protein
LEAPPGKKFIRGHYSRTPEAKAAYIARRKPIEPPNPSGLCLCGCGQPTTIAKTSSPKQGILAGHPTKFLRGHAGRLLTRERSRSWHGGRWVHKGGYIYIHAPDHPAANRDGYVYEHRLVMERKIGRYLEPHERVHHLDGIKTNNAEDNLVLFGSQREHMMAHPDHYASMREWNASHQESVQAAGRKGAAARWSKRKPSD